MNVLAGRLGLPESSSIEFRMQWKFLERSFLCELQCHNKTVDTSVPPTLLSIVGGYAHIAIARVENAVALYITGTETLMLEGAYGLSTNDVCIQGPASTCPSVITVTSHVAMIPVETLQEAETFCTGMKKYVPDPPLKAYGTDGERPGETCLEAVAGAGSGYRVAKILSMAVSMSFAECAACSVYAIVLTYCDYFVAAATKCGEMTFSTAFNLFMKRLYKKTAHLLLLVLRPPCLALW